MWLGGLYNVWLSIDYTWMIEYVVYGKADGPRGLYENWDFDQDGKITVDEVRIKNMISAKF